MQIFSSNMLREIGVSQAKHVLTQNNYSTRCRSFFFPQENIGVIFSQQCCFTNSFSTFHIFNHCSTFIYTENSQQKEKKICIKNVTSNFRIVETTYVKVADIYIFFLFNAGNNFCTSKPNCWEAFKTVCSWT